MKSFLVGVIVLIAATSMTALADSLDGALPIPKFTSVTATASATFDSVSRIYTYNYVVGNPGTNTGAIKEIGLDISSRTSVTYGDPNALTIRYGTKLFTFAKFAALLPPTARPMSPTGIAPPGPWRGAITASGRALFAGGGPAGSTIAPGHSIGGFSITSFEPPALRDVAAFPDWVYVATDPANPNSDVGDDQSARAQQIEASLVVHTYTLGPSDVFPGSSAHWNAFQDSLAHAIALGWVSDATLARTLSSQLAQALAAAEAGDGTRAKVDLLTLLNTLAASTASQRRQEVYDLVKLNADSLRANIADKPIR